MKIFWLIWILTVILLLLTPINDIPEIIIFLSLFVLVGFLAYSLNSNRKFLKKITRMVEKIDLTPLEDGAIKLERSQRECYLRLFKLESELKKRELEQEIKYRDLVRKVLEMDNKLNSKFKLLGEVVLKLGKEKKVD